MRVADQRVGIRRFVSHAGYMYACIYLAIQYLYVVQASAVGARVVVPVLIGGGARRIEIFIRGGARDRQDD